MNSVMILKLMVRLISKARLEIKSTLTQRNIPLALRTSTTRAAPWPMIFVLYGQHQMRCKGISRIASGDQGDFAGVFEGDLAGSRNAMMVDVAGFVFARSFYELVLHS
jgi:hypothetical protein